MLIPIRYSHVSMLACDSKSVLCVDVQVRENAKQDLKDGLALYNTDNNVGLRNAWNIIQAEVKDQLKHTQTRAHQLSHSHHHKRTQTRAHQRYHNHHRKHMCINSSAMVNSVSFPHCRMLERTQGCIINAFIFLRNPFNGNLISFPCLYANAGCSV